VVTSSSPPPAEDLPTTLRLDPAAVTSSISADHVLLIKSGLAGVLAIDNTGAPFSISQDHVLVLKPDLVGVLAIDNALETSNIDGDV
jgi:hypothetical protein